MNTWIDCDVRYADHLARIARVERDGRLRGCPTPDRGRSAAPTSPVPARYLRDTYGVARSVAAALGRIAALARDGRNGLSGKEQELAAHGVGRAADATDDALLARQIETARRPEPRMVPEAPIVASRA